MTKRIVAVIFAVVIAVSAAILPSSAAVTANPRLDDRADLLTPSEEAALTDTLSSLSSELDCDIVCVTAEDLSDSDFPHDYTSQDYADMYYESYGYAADGVLVLVVLSNEYDRREVYISTSGKCINRLSDDEREELLDDVIDNHNPDYNGYYDFLNAIALDLKKAIPPHLSWYMLPLAIGIGFLIALLIMRTVRGQLKSVSMQRGAASYIRAGSMNLTASRDTYLYSTVSRTAKPKDSGSGSSTHSSSGGGTHGGGGRSF